MSKSEEQRYGKRTHASHAVAGLLGSILTPHARKRGFSQSSILSDWPSIVGPALARRCQPLHLDGRPGRYKGTGRGAVLQIRAPGSIALELQHEAPQIIERINQYFGFKAVRSLVLRQGPLKKSKPKPEQPRVRSLSDEEVASIEHSLSECQQPSLKSALLSLGCAIKASGSPSN